MDWRAEALVLASRPHGEAAAILDLFTREHGRQTGLLRGGSGRRMAPHVQPGNQVLASGRSRLDSHLGTLVIDPLFPRAAGAMGDRLALAGLSAVCALLVRALPDRLALPPVYDATQTLLDALGLDGWPLLYLHWEMNLLAALGFGLDLSTCAVTGATEGLVWVSPKSGRAVSAPGAKGWEDRLLPLPACLTGPSAECSPEALGQGLRLTGFFLEKGLCADPGTRSLPEARARFVTLVQAARPG
jgi:DNA repair protein RecO (recombination protein O)